ncbi:hypothetical protein D0Y50_00610 [Salinimonas sediminis]|uniref:Uncharacterized protein n=1 Tax=Salinimonas sediminis TaxID=2303538 RepID=A0A346NHJ1_9ALTE|nr:hypothetical protein D0Y50_00610 [Salinimonas sediminis]
MPDTLLREKTCFIVLLRIEQGACQTGPVCLKKLVIKVFKFLYFNMKNKYHLLAFYAYSIAFLAKK